MVKKKKHSRNFAAKMADINEIAVTYRQHLARLPKHNTSTDYTKRLAMLERWCSMHGITCVEEIDFLQFLDWVFYDRGVSPRTRNNYRTWCRSFCSWLRLTPNPMDDIKPMKEPGKIRQPLPTAMLRQIREHLTAHDRHYLLAVMLEYYTFIRPGELAELKVGDIDVKRHAIHVRASISKNSKAIAVKDGQSSSVATASYVIALPRTVTVTVTDGTNPVAGAVVKLGNNVPTSQSGGSYVFSVPDGTYTLSVSKAGFLTHTEQMTISANTNKSVTLTNNLLRYAILANSGCMGSNKPTYPIMATIMPKSAAPNDLTNDGAYLQAGNINRCSIVVPRDNADEPVTWQAWRVGDSATLGGQDATDAKAAYSLVEWPLDVDEIEIKLTNSNYWIGGRVMSKNNTDLVQYTAAAYDQGGSNTVYRLSRSNYPNAFYIAIWFKYQSAGTSWPNPTMETLGLSVTAVAD